MVNGAGGAEVVPVHDLTDGGSSIGGKVDRDNQRRGLAAAPIRTGGVRCRGLGHVRASSIGVERR